MAMTEGGPRGGTRAFAWLLLGGALLLISNGRWIVPAAAWLAPVFLLRFVRTQRAAVGLPIGAVACCIVSAIAWWKLIPLPGAAYFAVSTLFGLLAFVPYVLDRLLRRRTEGILSTLVFPVAVVVIEFANAALSPYGSWGSVAYTQGDDLPLMQLVSVTGIWGVTFLVAWFASVVNAAWEGGFEWPRFRASAAAFAIVLALVHLGGGARLLRPAGWTVRVASFTVTPHPRPDIGDILWAPKQGTELEALRARLASIHDTLFASVRREALAGAKLVFWSECNAVVLKDDEPALIERGAEVARELKIHLGMSLATATPGAGDRAAGFYENQLVLLDPDGRVVTRYHKARPVPGDPEKGADAHLPIVDVPFGRLAGAICLDGDFPSLIREAGRGRADILIVPSSDWRAIDPIHTRMALVRAIENGCSLVRQTNLGLSAAVDAKGRPLAAVDYFRATRCVMVAQVPMKGVRTLYSLIGDAFAWASVVALPLLGFAQARGANKG